MAIDRRTAARELRTKLQLEAGFVRRWRRVERALLRTLASSLDVASVVPDLRTLTLELAQPALLSHYRKVSSVFVRNISDQLPEEQRLTAEEEQILRDGLEAHWPERALASSRAIADTNTSDAEQAVRIATVERERLLAQQGESMNQRTFAVVAAAAFDRRLKGRTTGIVMLETQGPAELVKAAEAGILVSAPVGLASFATNVVEAIRNRLSRHRRAPVKEWVTMGDSRVRPGHRAADSQQVPSDQPFMVAGERLMHPGDRSLGASIGNVINCRCSAVYDTAEISAMRV